VLLVLLASGCDLFPPPADSGELARLQVEHASMTARMDMLELRVLSLEAKVEAPEPAPVAVAPAPAPRPLVVPTAPKPAPAPAPVVPAGPVGKVQVASPRDGLSITIDDVLRLETTPALILLSPGRHTVKVEGYEKQEIRVIENETTMVIPR
jgi:hypothetical protein